jgi:hypothetical protein
MSDNGLLFVTPANRDRMRVPTPFELGSYHDPSRPLDVDRSGTEILHFGEIHNV